MLQQNFYRRQASKNTEDSQSKFIMVNKVKNFIKCLSCFLKHYESIQIHKHTLLINIEHR